MILNMREVEYQNDVCNEVCEQGWSSHDHFQWTLEEYLSIPTMMSITHYPK